jgi:hypothetical protein
MVSNMFSMEVVVTTAEIVEAELKDLGVEKAGHVNSIQPCQPCLFAPIRAGT